MLIDSKWLGKQTINSQALSARKSSSELGHYSESATVREMILQEARRIGQNVHGFLSDLILKNLTRKNNINHV